jgi:hypothetical protein
MYKKSKKTLDNGDMPTAKELVCNRCGQTESIIESLEWYDPPVIFLSYLKEYIRCLAFNPDQHRPSGQNHVIHTALIYMINHPSF